MEEAEDDQNRAPALVATHTIVDKAVSFVAKNGPEFETRIIASNAGNPKFNFLNAYHAYYQHRIACLSSVPRREAKHSSN